MASSKSMGRKPTPKKTTEENKKYLCPYCGKEKVKDDFYVSSDPLVITGITTMCRDCAEKIARNWDSTSRQYGDCTRASIQEALERLDKPWLEDIYESSYFEVNNPKAEKRKNSVWGAYIKNIAMQQYRTLRWRDGDIYSAFREKAEAAVTPVEEQLVNSDTFKGQEILEEYKKNKDSVIRMLGYDPFETEAECDKPLLYSQLVGYLDMGGDNEDMMRTSSAVTIVRGFLQQSKLDDMLAKSMVNITADGKAGEIKSLLDSKQKISSTISQLAEQSCLSLKHNKNASKGENTWTGKIKKLKDIDLRDAEVNGFDIGTCRGMQQVLELSDASIMKQLRLDESEWSDMVADQRKLIVDLQNELSVYKEINRILLRENLDLRDTLEENGMLDDKDLKNLKELFSPLGEASVAEDEGAEDEE